MAVLLHISSMGKYYGMYVFKPGTRGTVEIVAAVCRMTFAMKRVTPRMQTRWQRFPQLFLKSR